MKRFDWNIEKNEKLIKGEIFLLKKLLCSLSREICLILLTIRTLSIIGRKCLFWTWKGDVHIVPFMETEEAYLLITIFQAVRRQKNIFKEGSKYET